LNNQKISFDNLCHLCRFVVTWLSRNVRRQDTKTMSRIYKKVPVYIYTNLQPKNVYINALKLEK
jgi:hypothetical protein